MTTSDNREPADPNTRSDCEEQMGSDLEAGTSALEQEWEELCDWATD